MEPSPATGNHSGNQEICEKPDLGPMDGTMAESHECFLNSGRKSKMAAVGWIQIGQGYTRSWSKPVKDYAFLMGMARRVRVRNRYEEMKIDPEHSI